jgi:hypothetical protein
MMISPEAIEKFIQALTACEDGVNKSPGQGIPGIFP